MCPSTPYPWGCPLTIWTLAKIKIKKEPELTACLPHQSSTNYILLSTLRNRCTNQKMSNWPGAFGWLGRPLIIQNPLWGILRNRLLRNSQEKAIQCLKPPLKLREIGFWGVDGGTRRYTCVVPGAASVSLRLGLGHIPVQRGGSWGFWPLQPGPWGWSRWSEWVLSLPCFQWMPLPKLVRM